MSSADSWGTPDWRQMEIPEIQYAEPEDAEVTHEGLYHQEAGWTG